MKQIKILIFLFLFCPFFTEAFAASAVVTTDTRNPALNETFVLKVTLKGVSGRVFLPPIEGLKVLSSGNSSKTTIINGHVEEEVIFSYSVLPFKEGKIEIPSFKIKTNKGMLKTNRLSLNVKKRSSKDVSGNESFFAKAYISDAKPYISEKVVYKIEIYRDEKVGRIGFQEPEFKNFIAARQQDRTTSMIIGGKAYNVTELIYELVPVKEGKGQISETTVEGEILYRSKRRQDPFLNDPFFSSSFSSKRKIILSNPVEYEIRQLPKTDLASFFTNIVGKISGSSEIDKTEVNSDDFLNYKITIRGRGNLSELKLPDLNFSSEYKVYKDEPTFNLKKGEKGEEGIVVSGFAIVPSSPGEFRIPGFKLRYFDTESEKWEEIKIEEKAFKVTGEKKISTPSAPVKEDRKPEPKKKTGKIPESENIVKNDSDILYIKDRRVSLFTHRPDYKNYFILSVIPGFFLVFSVLIKTFFPGFITSFQKRRNNALKRIDNIENKADEKQKAFELKDIINGHISEKFNKNTENLSLEDSEYADELKELITTIEGIQFSNINSATDLDSVISRTRELIKRI